jgi:hypothetical protein
MSESDRDQAHEERSSERANPREHVREMEEHLRLMGERLRRLDEQLSHLEAQDDRGVDRGTTWPSGG